MSEHLECRQFDVLECVPESDAKMLGSFIVGIPTMTVREFQNGYPSFELESAHSGEHLVGRETKNRSSSLG